MKISTQLILSGAIAYTIFFIFPNIITDYKFKDKYKAIDSNKKTIVVYDNFHTSIKDSYKEYKTHGALVSYVLAEAMKTFDLKSNNYNIVHIDSQKFQYGSFFHILEKISKKTRNKKIFINMSILPTQGLGVDYFIQELNDFSKSYPNIYFFSSAGNCEYYPKNVEKVKLLSYKLENDKDFKTFALTVNHVPKFFVKSYSLYVFYRYMLNLLIGSRNEKIQIFVNQYVDLNNSENTIIVKSLHQFLFSANIHAKNVIVVGSKDIFNEDKYKIHNNLGVMKAIQLSDKLKDINSSRLDPHISFLNNIMTREISTFYYDRGKYFVPIAGSSYSSPIALARFLKKSEE